MSRAYHYDAIVIGGGAAGLFYAAQAGQRGKRVAVLERSGKVARKVLMSGGGRCNFTNLNSTPANFISANLHFCKSALSRYTPWDFLGLVLQYEIPYHEKTAGQLFCDRSAKDIVRLLSAECERAGVDIHLHCDIQQIDMAAGYCVHTGKGAFKAEALVVATGGLSIPSMGVTPLGYELAERVGMALQPLRPGLVPFVFTDEMKLIFAALSGVSLPVTVATPQRAFTDALLFTHRGLSGPAMLQISSFWQSGEALALDVLPHQDAVAWLLAQKAQQQRQVLRTLLQTELPKALVMTLQAQWWPELTERPLLEWSKERLLEIGGRLNAWTLRPAATEGYRTAEVTLGGVDTAELSSKTMESQRQSGLFFIGEVVDVTGELGGHNFQWAWASAHAAAQAL